jgi:hypothetical protein
MALDYRYNVIPIVPSRAGIGKWQQSPYTSKARTIKEAVRNLTHGAQESAVELPDAGLAAEGKDITGLIISEPTRVFAYRDPYVQGDYAYFGIEERR